MKAFIFILLFGLTTFTFAQKKHIYVADYLVDCVGITAQKCMLIKDHITDPWANFYDNIEGFDYEEGYTYLLSVKTKKIKNPPADGANFKYILVEVFEKIKSKKPITLNNNWEIITIKNLDTISNNPTITFENAAGKVTGFSGCNKYFGSYQTENTQLKLGQIGMTKMMCPNATTESTFIKQLGHVFYYKIENEKLLFYDKENHWLMTFGLLE